MTLDSLGLFWDFSGDGRGWSMYLETTAVIWFLLLIHFSLAEENGHNMPSIGELFHVWSLHFLENGDLTGPVPSLWIAKALYRTVDRICSQ